MLDHRRRTPPAAGLDDHHPPRSGPGRAGPVPDLVNRDFSAARPDQLWLADITYVRTFQGLFLPGDGAGCVQPPDRRVDDG
jgi:transposase InsO family protein